MSMSTSATKFTLEALRRTTLLLKLFYRVLLKITLRVVFIVQKLKYVRKKFYLKILPATLRLTIICSFDVSGI